MYITGYITISLCITDYITISLCITGYIIINLCITGYITINVCSTGYITINLFITFCIFNSLFTVSLNVRPTYKLQTKLESLTRCHSCAKKFDKFSCKFSHSTYIVRFNVSETYFNEVNSSYKHLLEILFKDGFTMFRNCTNSGVIFFL